MARLESGAPTHNYELGAITDGGKKLGRHTRFRKPIPVGGSASDAEVWIGEKGKYGCCQER